MVDKRTPVNKTGDNTDKKVEGTPQPSDFENQMLAMMEMIKNQNKVIAKMAKNNPVAKTNHYDSRDNEVGQGADRVMSSTGTAELSLAPPEFKTVDKYTPEKMEMLAFMEEELTITVLDSTNENDVVVPVVYNDGRAQYFIRNQEQVVKRKYIEVLARSKKTTYSQRKERNFNGDEQYVNTPHTALVYPFVINHDPSGTAKGSKGYQWFKTIQKEA